MITTKSRAALRRSESWRHAGPPSLRLHVGVFCAVASVWLTIATPRPSSGQNVATFTRATIQQMGQMPPGPPGTDPIDLDIDPNIPPDDAMSFAVSPGSLVEIKIYGTAIAPGDVWLTLWDDDTETESFRGADDYLDRDFGTATSAGGPFVITLGCSCMDGFFTIHGYDNSGEQSAELFVSDGTNGIPKNRSLPGGGSEFTYWQIQCKKDTSQAIGPSGGSINMTWGDTLAFFPGALASTTTIHVTNPHPIPNAKAVPARFSSISEALTIEPGNMSYPVPAQLTFKYTREEALETPYEDLLRPFRFNSMSGSWEPLASFAVDTVNNLVVLPVGQAGTYGFAAGLPSPVPGMTPLGRFAAAIAVLACGSAAMLLRRRRRAYGAVQEGP